jgi:hypothetical protein
MREWTVTATPTDSNEQQTSVRVDADSAAEAISTATSENCHRTSGANALFTRDQVSTAMNAGADLVRDDPGLQLGDLEIDVINLVINAAMTQLDNPTVSLDEVMNENYDGGATEVRSWWDWA